MPKAFAASGTRQLFPCDKPGSLLLATRKLVCNDPRTQEQLARDLDIPFHWLRAFMAGVSKSTGVNRVQYIYEKLSGHKVIY